MSSDDDVIKAVIPLNEAPGWAGAGIDSKASWLEAIAQMMIVHRCTRRELGLLLLLGENRGYGKLKAWCQSEEWVQRKLPSYSTCVNSRCVAKALEDRWNPHVDYEHHAAVAPLPADRQTYFLALAEQDNLSPKDLKKLIKAEPRKSPKRGRAAKPPAVDTICDQLQEAVEGTGDALRIYLDAKTIAYTDCDHAAKVLARAANYLSATAADLAEEAQRVRRLEQANEKLQTAAD